MQQSLGLKESRPNLVGPLLALTLALGTPALAAGTPAGTIIRNQATLEYRSVGGTPEVVLSPPVETVVNPICSASVLPNGTVSAPGQSLTLDPGASGLLRYTLFNAGNTTNTYGLSAVNEAGSEFAPQLAVYQDLNGNGRVDAGEGPLSSVAVRADQTVNLLVQVATTSASRGTAFPNLIASCGGATGGAGRDGDNVSQVILTTPPVLALQKTFTPDTVRPGAETTVNLTLTNTGGDSQPAVLTDLLNTPELRDFVFVSGSARIGGSAAAGAALEYTADGGTWNTAQPGTVAGIRVRTASVPAGGTLQLTFTLRAPRVAATTRRNVATLVSGAQTIEATAPITIRPVAEIALGPQGNPRALPGGEMSPDDRQVRDSVVGGQEVCFTHTVQNLGDLPDTITTGVARLSEGASVRLRDAAGTPLNGEFVVTLDPQQTADFQACYTYPSPEQTTFEAVLVSRSSQGAAENRTVDQITTVYPNTIGLTKTSDRGQNALVGPGDELTYTLSFTNTLPVPLIDVVVRDSLGVLYPPGTPAPVIQPTAISRPGAAGQTVSQPGSKVASTATGSVTTTGRPLSSQATSIGALEFVRADQGGVLENGEVVWRLGTVQPGQTVTLRLTVRVPETATDGTVIHNIYTLTSRELPTPLVSPPATNTVFNPSNFELSKTSNPTTVVFGEAITYIFTVTNKSTLVPLKNVEIQDTLPAGLNYVPGSSGYRAGLSGEFVPIQPVVRDRTYVWTIPEVAPGASAQVSFRAIVTPDAGTQLRNNAIGRAIASERETNSRPSQVINRVEPLSFGVNNADVVGYVFLDRNRNGVYDYLFDLPCPKARVILANGRIALTDNEGRYHFRNVREQTWGLRLDPNSVALPALQVPQDSGRPGSRQVYVRGLTSVDFPLAPDGGDIAVIRDTTLRITGGPEGAQKTMQVQKQVFTTADAGVYRVQLILGNGQPLPGFTLTDPLPAGAQLVDGENVLNFDPLPSGERAVTYRFRWQGDSKAAVTDPTASWRY